MALDAKGALIHKFDTAAGWSSNDPLLMDGEIGWESDTGKVKKGDGSTQWSALGYFNIYTSSGADGLGLTWNFDTTTTATPASGDIRFNNATPASVTAIYIHETGAVTGYGREMLTGLKVNDYMLIQVVGDTSKYLYASVTSLTDNGSDWTLGVAVSSSGSLPANNDVVSVIPVYVSTSGTGMSDLVDDTTPQLGGDLDLNGNNIDINSLSSLTAADLTTTDEFLISDASDSNASKKIPAVALAAGLLDVLQPNLFYTWNTLTSATDPTATYFQVDNAAAFLASATALYVSTTTYYSSDVYYIWKNLKTGDYIIGQPANGGTELLVLEVSSTPTDNTTWFNIPITVHEGPTGISSAYGYEFTILPFSAISDIVSDTTPQLGGNLDAQTYNITNIGNIEVEGHSYADAEVDDGNSSTADTIDWTTGNFHKSTMTGNCTYTFTAPSGATTLILKLVQGGSGSYTATWPATVKWPGGTAPTLSTAASSVDIVTFYWDGSAYYGTSVLNMS